MATTHSTSTVLLQDGEYSGKISGYTIQVIVKASDISMIDVDLPLFKNHSITTEFEVANGVRGHNIPCEIVVKNHKAVVTF